MNVELVPEPGLAGQKRWLWWQGNGEGGRANWEKWGR